MAIVFQRAVASTGQSLSIDVGAQDNDRLLIIQVGDESIQTDDVGVSQVTVDGKNATLQLSKTNPDGIGNHQELWTMNESQLGTSTGTVTVAGAGVDTGSAVRAYLWYGVDQNDIPHDSDFDDVAVAPTTPDINLDVPANGMVFYGAGNGSSGGTSGWTSPLTERVDGATSPPSSAVLGGAEGIETSAQTGKLYSVTVGTGTLRSTGLGLSFSEASTGETASGTPSIPAVTASGAATVIKSASGAATLAAIVAAGSAVLVFDSSGNPELAPVEASGAAVVRKQASGTPSITAIEASGNADVTGIVNANGTPSIPAVEAAGTAGLRRNASGSPSIPALTASGEASVPFQASGSPSLPAIESAGVALVVRIGSDGSPSVAVPVAAGSATVGRSASGTPTIPSITASGAAQTGAIKSSSGAANIPVIEANGAGQVTRSGFGSVIAPAIQASGGAEIRKPASGAVSIPAVTASGTAQIFKTSSGAASTPGLLASGVAVVGGIPIFQSTEVDGLHPLTLVIEGRAIWEIEIHGRSKGNG